MKVLLIAIFAVLIILPATVFADSVSYSPLRDNQTPNGPYPTVSEITEDMQKMVKENISKIRIYDTGQNLESILGEAEKNKIGVAIGIDLTGNYEEDKKKIQEIIHKSSNYKNVDSFIIGNNPLFNNQTTLEKLVNHIKYAKTLTDIPITSINGFDFWENHYYDPLYDAVDFIMVDLFVHNSSTPEKQIQLLKEKYNTIQKDHKKPIVVESGWSTVNSSKYAQQSFRSELLKTGINVYFFEWADEGWKHDPIEAGYGIYKADRTVKQDTPENTVDSTFWGQLTSVIKAIINTINSIFHSIMKILHIGNLQ